MVLILAVSTMRSNLPECSTVRPAESSAPRNSRYASSGVISSGATTVTFLLLAGMVPGSRNCLQVIDEIQAIRSPSSVSGFRFSFTMRLPDGNFLQVLKSLSPISWFAPVTPVVPPGGVPVGVVAGVPAGVVAGVVGAVPGTGGPGRGPRLPPEQPGDARDRGRPRRTRRRRRRRTRRRRGRFTRFHPDRLAIGPGHHRRAQRARAQKDRNHRRDTLFCSSFHRML